MTSRSAAPSAALNPAAWMAEQLAAPTPDFAAIAATLMGLGLAAEAARCHGWSLLPPGEAEWRQALQGWSQRIGCQQAEAPDSTIQQHLNPAAADLEVELQAIQGLMDAGDLPAACERMTRLSHSSALPANLCNRAGMLHAALGDHWQAERWYRTSLVQQQAQVQPWLGLAGALLQQQAFDEALEAVQVALNLYPDHPWGLKLQQHALQGLGARQVLLRLAELGQLPFGLEALPTAHSPGFDAASAPALGLSDKLRLQPLLQAEPLRLWVVGAGGHQLLQWLAQQRLLPCRCHVQVFADPDADLHRLATPEGTTLELEPSLPLYRLRQQQALPAFTILTFPGRTACPQAIGPLLAHPAPLLVDRRVALHPLQHRVTLSTEAWDLWVPSTSV